MSLAESWLAALPNDARTPEYSTHVLQGVHDRILRCEWLPVVSQARGHRAVFYVSDDAMHVVRGDGSRWRPQASAELLQHVADILGASLCTSKVCDLAYEQAIGPVLRACPEDTSTPEKQALMSKRVDSDDYNNHVEEQRAGREGLLRDVGKTWVLSNLLSQRAAGTIAVNYGFFDPRAPYLSHSGQRLWQSRGTRHSNSQFDYSQTLILMTDQCELDGDVVPVAKIMQSVDLADLISDEGPLKFIRQPGVAPLSAVPAYEVHDTDPPPNTQRSHR